MSINTYLDDLESTMNDDNVAYTENGALAYKTTGSSLLDFFSNGGALRSRTATSITQVFDKAYAENPLLATKAMFYFRDVRGGQGERNTFRILLAHCAVNHPEAILPNLPIIAEYGRWDDLYSLIDTPLENDIWALIDIQLAEDGISDNPSLLAKWLPSENTHAHKRYARVRRLMHEGTVSVDDQNWYKTCTPRYGRKTRKALNMSSKHYRVLLSHIRRNIGLVEQQISDGLWGEIQYDKIPSKAGLQYRKAFYHHDAERYSHFLEEVKAGTKTINAGTLYPYEIVEKTKATGWHPSRISDNEAATLDAMWNALPDYFDGNETNGLVVADVSGSMSGRPMDVSISLAIYVAERNKGPFHNKFITFSRKPRLQTVSGGDIVSKVKNLSKAHWDMNTNIEAVFQVILDTAIDAESPQEDIPSHLYIVSDMEFDAAQGYNNRANERLFQTIDKRFADAGYKMPFLVFWNVDSRNDQEPMKMDDRGFQMVSGCSPSIFKSLLSNKAVSAYDLMLAVLNQDRYTAIHIEE